MAYIGTGLALCIASQCTNHTGLVLCIDTSNCDLPILGMQCMVRRSCCEMLDCCCVPCIFPTCGRAWLLFAGLAWSHWRRGGRFADDRVECTSGVQHWQSDSSDRSVHSIAHYVRGI